MVKDKNYKKNEKKTIMKKITYMSKEKGDIYSKKSIQNENYV